MYLKVVWLQSASLLIWCHILGYYNNNHKYIFKLVRKQLLTHITVDQLLMVFAVFQHLMFNQIYDC